MACPQFKAFAMLGLKPRALHMLSSAKHALYHGATPPATLCFKTLHCPQLVILLPLPPKCWDYKQTPPHPGIQSFSGLLGTRVKTSILLITLWRSSRCYVVTVT
jgi:hypothetical protein